MVYETPSSAFTFICLAAASSDVTSPITDFKGGVAVCAPASTRARKIDHSFTNLLGAEEVTRVTGYVSINVSRS